MEIQMQKPDIPSTSNNPLLMVCVRQWPVNAGIIIIRYC